MKLLDILARDMKVWPDDGTEIVGQAADGSLHLNGGLEKNRGFTDDIYEMASDWRAEDVTRDEWQAAVGALSASRREMSDLMREEFEIAFVARCKEKGQSSRLNRFDDGRYEYLEASDAWWGWQASRECLVIELPESVTNSGTAYIETIRTFIEKQGIKTK